MKTASIAGAMIVTDLGLLLIAAAIGFASSATSGLSFASYYGSHMVLQRGPQKAVLWGYAQTLGDTVSVSMNGTKVAMATVVKRPDGKAGGVWQVKLPAMTSVEPVTIIATSSDGTATLRDVLFGDVWLCSGQSNMYFQMRQVFNSTYEMHRALQFKTIRMMAVGLRSSDVSLLDVPSIVTHWTQPHSDVNLGRFSAVCLLYAMNLSPTLGYPIGLVETSWGGTRIEPWSSKEALATCAEHPGPVGRKRVTLDDSAIWNSMVNPFINMTIYGAIWYQGESNAGLYQAYSCQFPAMIDDWRLQFHQGSQGETNSLFPFGFVQLSAYRNITMHITMPDLRWAQTANVGYVPNPRMQNVFMAVAMDLPDFHSPYGAIHPRDKEDVADRLALAARAVAYKEVGVAYQGPRPTSYRINYSAHTLNIEFNNGHSPIQVRNTAGFQVCCKHTETTHCDRRLWTDVVVKQNDVHSVTLDITPCHGTNSMVSGVRYAWGESPCPFKQCAIYGRDTELPAPAFTKNGPFPRQ